MSERGSFCSEYVYCEKCFQAAAGVLNAHGSFDTCPMNGHPILAGKAKGLWGGEEAFNFEHQVKPELEKVLCHDLCFIVFPEQRSSATVFKIIPKPRPPENPAT